MVTLYRTPYPRNPKPHFGTGKKNTGARTSRGSKGARLPEVVAEPAKGFPKPLPPKSSLKGILYVYYKSSRKGSISLKSRVWDSSF